MMRKYFAILMMACILIGGCGAQATTQATVETATTQATDETATTQATVETATTQATVETATTQATVETATTQATVETATTQATVETATTQATAETSTEQEHVEPYGIYTVYYEDKEVQVEWQKDAITFIIGTAKYTEEEEDWMEKTYEILSNPQKKVEFEDEYAYEEDDKFIQLETPSGMVFQYDELPKSTSEWFMVNIEAYWTITSLEESF